MTRSRISLHVLALLLPLFALAALLQTTMGTVPVDDRMVGMVWPIIVAAQLAALAGWPLLQRAGSASLIRPLAVGLGMAVLTHLLAGPLMLGSQAVIAGKPLLEPLHFGVVVAVYSLYFIGWLSVPLTMAAAVFVHRLRRKELSRAVA